LRSSPAAGPPGRRGSGAEARWTTVTATAVVVVSVAVTVLYASAGAGGIRVYPADGQDGPLPGDAVDSHPLGRVAGSTAYAPFTGPGFVLDVPSAWQRDQRPGYASFTDRTDLVAVEWARAAHAPTVPGVRSTDVPALAAQARTFTLRSVAAVRRPAGSAVEIAYLQAGSLDPLTGRTTVHAVERYCFFHAGTRVTVTLAGPEGTDNSAAWRRITDSLRWIH
jgi:hypothetical protein